MAPPPEYLEPTFGQRFLARLVDGLILLAPLVVLAIVLGRFGSLLGLLVTAAYEITLIDRDGQTVGKRVLGIRVVDAETGARPPTAQAVRRWVLLGGAGWLLSSFFLPPIFGLAFDLAVLVMVLRPPLHQGPHDLFAGTIVTKVH
jgi:uncharacterized RDD family membrane protein YckC